MDEPKPRSGKFLLRLPVSLHTALHEEAKREGVSLVKLIVAKLAIPLARRLGVEESPEESPDEYD